MHGLPDLVLQAAACMHGCSCDLQAMTTPFAAPFQHCSTSCSVEVVHLVNMCANSATKERHTDGPLHQLTTLQDWERDMRRNSSGRSNGADRGGAPRRRRGEVDSDMARRAVQQWQASGPQASDEKSMRRTLRRRCAVMHCPDADAIQMCCPVSTSPRMRTPFHSTRSAVVTFAWCVCLDVPVSSQICDVLAGTGAGGCKTPIDADAFAEP